MKRKGPWIDRNLLIQEATNFVATYGKFIQYNADRISALFEMAVYNEIVRYYDDLKYTTQPQPPGQTEFHYRNSPTRLDENSSFFRAALMKNGEIIDSVDIYQNLKLQSGYDGHIYYNADISVCRAKGCKTDLQKSKIRHSFIPNNQLVTFIEVKHLNPFPEVVFSFTGLLLEFSPKCVLAWKAGSVGNHLCPAMVFSGDGSKHTRRIINSLSGRYGINFVTGLQSTDARIPKGSFQNTY